MCIAEVETRTFAAQLTAVRRAVLRPSEVSDWLPIALGDIADSLRKRIVLRTPKGWTASTSPWT